MSEENNRNYVLGCDIGNGFSYVSMITDKDKDPMPLMPNDMEMQRAGVPTTVYVSPPDGKKIILLEDGKAAAKLSKYTFHPEHMVSAIKSKLREKYITVPGINKPVEVSDLYAAAVRDIVEAAHDNLKHRVIKPVYNMVFAFPANLADDAAMLDTMQRAIESVEIGGKKIHVVGRLPEPAAVAIDYLYYMQHIAPEEIRIKSNRFTVLVYDLGHGTFDTAVVTAKSAGDPYTLHSKDALPDVGGKDFDTVLYNEIISQLKENYSYEPTTPRQKEFIRQTAVEAKLSLSSDTEFEADIQDADGEYCQISISRERFEQISEHLIMQTLEMVQNMLDQAESSGIKIDCIVLSGGGSEMPMVEAGLKELAEGKYRIIKHRLSTAVSYGAARFGIGVANRDPNPDPDSGKENNTVPAPDNDPINKIIRQLTDRSYGLWVPAEGKLEGEIRFVIPKGKQRPVTSEPLQYWAMSSNIYIKLYRTRSNNKVASPNDMECENIEHITFDVEPNVQYTITVTLEEDYGIRVDLKKPSGELYASKRVVSK